jgi:hypothetical protein
LVVIALVLGKLAILEPAELTALISKLYVVAGDRPVQLIVPDPDVAKVPTSTPVFV